VPVTFKPKFGVKVVVNDNSFRVLRIGKAANRVPQTVKGGRSSQADSGTGDM